MLAERTHQAELVEGWRTQLVDEATDVGDRVLHLGAQLDQQPLGPLRVVGDGAARRVQAQDRGGQRRTQPVVEVATDPAAFLLPSRDQPLPGVLEVGGQTHGVHRDAGLHREVVQEPLIGCGEVAAGGDADHQVRHGRSR